MQYRNDLRVPVIVLTGTLNPAILNPAWVSLNILGYEVGAVLNFHQAVYPDGQDIRQMFVMDGIGWSVNNRRCEIFITSLDPEVLQRAEIFCVRLIETLPHTPWSGGGINFQFNAVEDDLGIIDQFNTPENFEGHFSVGDQTISTELIINPNLTLNVQRNVYQNDFTILFNNHHHQVNAANVAEVFNGALLGCLERCRKIMTDFYQMTEELAVFLAPGEGEVVNEG